MVRLMLVMRRIVSDKDCYDLLMSNRGGMLACKLVSSGEGALFVEHVEYSGSQMLWHENASR